MSPLAGKLKGVPDHPEPPAQEPELRCVGALIRDGRHRVFAHRRSPTRKLFPLLWDIVGGHVDPGETVEDALAREIEEETGWTLRTVQAQLPTWDWTANGQTRREYDFLVEVDGELSRPRLEDGKHDAYEWVGPDNLDLMMANREDGDRRLRDVVARATRTRFTERLRLDPAGSDHADELWRMHQDPAVAEWHGGPWTTEAARFRAEEYGKAWESEGVSTWVAYEGDDHEPVGRGGLSYVDIEGERRLEVGWTVRSGRWGQGIGTEIGRAALAYGFDEAAPTRWSRTPSRRTCDPVRSWSDSA